MFLTMVPSRGDIKDDLAALLVPDRSDYSYVRKMRSASKWMIGQNVISWLQISAILFMLIPYSILHT